MRNKHDSRAESFIDINVAYFCRYVKHKYVNNCRKGKNKSTCESSLSVCLPAFLPISRVDIAQHTSAYTHNCISYSNTPNTGCPVLGVHITFYSRVAGYNVRLDKQKLLFIMTCFENNQISKLNSILNQKPVHRTL